MWGFENRYGGSVMSLTSTKRFTVRALDLEVLEASKEASVAARLPPVCTQRFRSSWRSSSYICWLGTVRVWDSDVVGFLLKCSGPGSATQVQCCRV